MNSATINFINKSIIKHGLLYDYSLVNYTKTENKVDIICPKHGVFSQRAKNHISGNGCLACAKENFILAGKVNRFDSSQACDTSSFVEKAKKTHGNRYDYRLVNYINSREKVTIICKQHGIFEQRPDHHVCGNDCPACMNSLNESKKLIVIDDFLNTSNVTYVREKTFVDCKCIKLLRFDRYIEELNLCIEYDGEQHFRKSEFFGGEEKLKDTQKRDRIKNKYCKENKINLLRIKDKQDPIEQIEKIISKIKNNDKPFIHIFYGKQK